MTALLKATSVETLYFDRIRAFAARLRNQGIEATVRRSRGLDIDAACGQLRVATEKRRRTENSAAGLHPGTNLIAPNQRKTTPSARRVRVVP